MEQKIVLKRKIYNKLLEWKEKYAPDYVLFLKGARRVGKRRLPRNSERKNISLLLLSTFNVPMIQSEICLLMDLWIWIIFQCHSNAV